MTYCLLIAYRLPLMPICPAIMDMGPGRGPMAQKERWARSRARALFGPWARVPGPYPLWLGTWASRAIDRQSIGKM